MKREVATERIKMILAEATAYEDAVCYVTSDDADALDMAIKALKQTRWIPVSEDLPEPWASVLITFSGKYGALTADHTVGIGSWDDANGWYFEEIQGYTDRLTVSAWMNLPESYKEGVNE